jgi:RNA-directed DNA polymerase
VLFFRCGVVQINKRINKRLLIPRWSTASESASDTFSHVFSIENINKAYSEQIEWKNMRAVDRMSSSEFGRHREEHFVTINKKCLNGTYRFVPFSERLRLRTRDKCPRVISVAAIRDRIVLYLLKEYLHEIFDDCVNRNLPNDYIRSLNKFCEQSNIDSLCLYKVDISSFYDNIDHKKLFNILRRRIKSKPELLIIRNAIETPTVPEDYRRDSQQEKVNQRGVPQGLAISNILANIFFQSCDGIFKKSSLLYLRYVDDMLFIVRGNQKAAIKSKVRTTLWRMGLKKNKNKSKFLPIYEGVDYLGYHLMLPKVSVKSTTIEHFLQAISAFISQYIRLGPTHMYQDVELSVAKESFLSDLNEKITGAISENKNYGWIFYFSELNDLSLLYGMDVLIKKRFLSRLTYDLLPNPEAVKKLTRAYYSVKYNRIDGYLHNYNIYDTIAKKRDFLNNRGEIRPNEMLTERDIEIRFDRFRRRRLSTLDSDVGEAS